MKQEQTFSEVQLQLMKWSQRTSQLIGRAFDEASKRFLPTTFFDDRECHVLWQLTGSCHSTSESALILIGNARLWDTEILVRSVVEGTLKLTFLTYGLPRERQGNLHEFDDVFLAMSSIKRHERVKDFLSIVENPNADEWRPLRDLLLSAENLKELQERYPKGLRQKLNQKWSFGELSAKLRNTKEPLYNIFGNMLHNYGMSSHIAHQDIVGIGMVWDRNKRNETRRTAAELAHGGRMIGEIAIMAILRLRALLRLWDADGSVLKSFLEEYQSITVETTAAGRRFGEVEYEAGQSD